MPPISGEASSIPAPELAINTPSGDNSVYSMLGLALIAGILLTAYKYYKNSKKAQENGEKDKGIADDFDRCV